MKRLSKYNKFLNLEPLNENLDKSKKFLKEREMLKIAATELGLIQGELKYEIEEGRKKTLRMSDFTPEQQQELRQKLREIRLSDEQIRGLERDPEFIKLRELIKDNIGYLYNFVYMYYVEMTPYNEIEALYNDVLEFRPLLDRLKDIETVGKKFDINFIDPTIPNEKEHRTNSEILTEGIEELKSYRKVKKIIDTLPPKLKRSYNDAPVFMKEQIAEIAAGFESIPDEMTKEGITKKERVWKNFFGELKLDTNERTLDNRPNPNFGKMVYQSRLRRFEAYDNPIREFIKAAKSHLESSLSDGYNERIEKINKAGDRFGRMGANIVFNQNGIIIVEVFSWPANNFLNSHCNHCIVNYQSYWNSYLGEYNKQYYIYNTNISSMDDKSTIGVTIQPNRSYTGGACQTVRNSYVSNFRQLLKDWERAYGIEEDLWDQLQPITQEEIARRERAKIANRKIVEPGLSIEEIKSYVRDDGADINNGDGKALQNAVKENDLEKTRVILQLGGNPNLKKGADAPISSAQNIEMIKLLVSFGSDMTGDVFKSIIGDPESLEFCLKAGLDPHFQNSLPIRAAMKGNWASRENPGNSYFESFKILLKFGTKLRDESSGRNMIMKWAAEYTRFDVIEHLKETGRIKDFTKDDWETAIKWIGHSRKMTDEDKHKMIQYLNDNIKEIYG